MNRLAPKPAHYHALNQWCVSTVCPQRTKPRMKTGLSHFNVPWAVYRGRQSPTRAWSPLGYQSVPLKLVRDPPQFGIDRLDLRHVGLGPPPVLRVRRYRPCLAFRCSRPGAEASVQPTPVPALERGLLAGCASAGFGQASRARPVGPETRCAARFDKICVVSFCHCSFPPFARLAVQSPALGHRVRGLTLIHGPCTPAHGPLLQRRETRLSDGFPVTRLVPFEQAAADQ